MFGTKTKIDIRMDLVRVLLLNTNRTADETIDFAKKVEEYVVGGIDLPDTESDFESAFKNVLKKAEELKMSDEQKKEESEKDSGE